MTGDHSDLDDLLRRALAAEAARVEPGDGLGPIRARTARRVRSGRLGWRAPALALAAAAAAVAALLAAPSLLPALEPAPARQPAAAPAPGPTPIPGAGVNDLRTVWPYGSRAEGFREAPADQAAGTYGDLTRPDQVAVRFVRSYLPDDSIRARSLGAYRAGLRMQVYFDGKPMTRVYLVRVRVGDDAPYVVVDAESDRISIEAQRPPASGGFNLHGTTTGSSVAEVRLRAAGSGTTLELADATVTEVGSGWIAPFRLPPGSRDVTAAAWAAGPDLSLSFAARPLG
ncbi:MAG TPA: hypothetical protein VI357_02160 [Mycobacteriales bacterium]